jgi:hypothetical protein
VAFLQSVVDTQARRREIHIIVDNLSAHKTRWSARSWPRIRRAPPLHADLFVVAESRGALVFEDRTRCHRAGHLHLGPRSPTEADAIHQAVQQDRETLSVVLCRSHEAHPLITIQVVRTVH